jgi:enoyl-CoA hydratase/carnithine racemase
MPEPAIGGRVSQDIEIAAANGIQTLRLTRAAKRNALTAAMYDAMSDALVAGDASPDVAVHMFLGSGGHFSSGNDLNDFLANTKGDAGAIGGVLRFIRTLPGVKKPMIAVVDGAATGIAVTLLFHCDLVYASPAATFSTPFLDLGLVPENGSSLLAPRAMGYARAFELLVLGETFSAERAREAGFVNAVVASDTIEETAIRAARRLAAKPPEALALSRKLMRGDTKALAERSHEEAVLFGERLKSPEAREAISAFLEKRKPDFAKLRSN